MRIEKDILIDGKHGKPVVADLFYRYNNVPKSVVIFSHGFKGFKDWGPYNLLAKKFAEQNFVFIKLNFAFNGTTPQTPIEFSDLDAFGNNNFTKELDDLDVLLNWLEQEKKSDINFNTENISLIGHSRGGGVSILKGYEDKRINRIIAWNSVNEFEKYLNVEEVEKWKKDGIIFLPNLRTGQQMPLYLQFYHDTKNNSKRFNIKHAVQNLDKPFLIIHSKEDETVGVNDAIEMHSWNKQSKLILIEGANHTFNTEHPFKGEKLPEAFEEAMKQTFEFLK